MVAMTALYSIGIAMALLIGGVIGLLLTAAHYQRAAWQRQRYERDVTEDAELYAAAHAAARRYTTTEPRNSTTTTP
jgi:hypothetical protein